MAGGVSNRVIDLETDGVVSGAAVRSGAWSSMARAHNLLDGMASALIPTLRPKKALASLGNTLTARLQRQTRSSTLQS